MSVVMVKSVLPFMNYPYSGESIACNLCGSKKSTILCKMDRRWKYLTSVVCNECGLIRTEPMPTEEELANYYQSQYRIEYQGSMKGPPKFHITRSLREAKKRIDLLSDYLLSGAEVLDLGCGSGEFLALARDRGCQVVGLEPGNSYAEYAQQKHSLNVHIASWDKIEFPRESFDVITAHHVLEHLRNPVGAVNSITNWLKTGGIVYLSVPNMLPNQKPSFERFHFAHIHGFTPKTLMLAAQVCGLSPVSTGSSLNTTTQLFRKASRQQQATDEGVCLEDQQRAQDLLDGYSDDSIFSYVIGGAYFAHLQKQVVKYYRDTFKHR